jgi:chorismate-pyruvate lyase
VHVEGQTLDLGLSTLQRVLVTYDGTMTRLLEAFAAEPVDVLKLRQSYETPTVREVAALDVGVETPILHREVVLQGVVTGRALLHARAVLVAERLPPSMIRALEITQEPIGNLLAAHRTETFREILEVGATPAGAAGRHFSIPPTAEMIYRICRISCQRRPIVLVTEQFPRHAFRACSIG